MGKMKDIMHKDDEEYAEWLTNADTMDTLPCATAFWSAQDSIVINGVVLKDRYGIVCSGKYMDDNGICQDADCQEHYPTEAPQAAGDVWTLMSNRCKHVPLDKETRVTECMNCGGAIELTAVPGSQQPPASTELAAFRIEARKLLDDLNENGRYDSSGLEAVLASDAPTEQCDYRNPVRCKLAKHEGDGHDYIEGPFASKPEVIIHDLNRAERVFGPSKPVEAVCEHKNAAEFELHFSCPRCNKIRRKDGRTDLNGNLIWEDLGPPCISCATFEFFHVDKDHEYEAFQPTTYSGETNTD